MSGKFWVTSTTDATDASSTVPAAVGWWSWCYVFTSLLYQTPTPTWSHRSQSLSHAFSLNVLFFLFSVFFTGLPLLRHYVLYRLIDYLYELLCLLCLFSFFCQISFSLLFNVSTSQQYFSRSKILLEILLNHYIAIYIAIHIIIDSGPETAFITGKKSPTFYCNTQSILGLWVVLQSKCRYEVSVCITDIKYSRYIIVISLSQ